MPNYVKHTLNRLQHDIPKCIQHVFYHYNKPAYGQRIQYAPQETPQAVLLPASAQKLIQRIIGIFLYYGIALDLTMLVILGTLATE